MHIYTRIKLTPIHFGFKAIQESYSLP